MTLWHNEKDDIPYYCTAIIFRLDTEKRTIEYVNAGHPSGYVLLMKQYGWTKSRELCGRDCYDWNKSLKKRGPRLDLFLKGRKNAQIVLFYRWWLLEANCNDWIWGWREITYFYRKKMGDLERRDRRFYKEEQKKAHQMICVLIMIQTNAK